MKFGVSLSAIAQQPAGVDMQQAFADICSYVGAARDLGFDMVYQGQHYLTDPYQQLQTMPLLARISAEARGMGLVADNAGAIASPGGIWRNEWRRWT